MTAKYKFVKLFGCPLGLGCFFLTGGAERPIMAADTFGMCATVAQMVEQLIRNQ